MSFTGPARRVWSATRVVESEAGWGVSLDAAPLRTPARAPLCLPARALAEAVAAEWAAQGETVKPETLPLTRLVNTAIDRVAPARAAVVEEIAGYGETDLLCYRAPHPAALVARQAAAWDGPLDWARTQLGVRLVCASGVMHVRQPPESLAALRAVVAPREAFALTALAELVALSGSLVLGLAVADGAMVADEAWAASRVDEAWQIEQWGEDGEAAEAAALKRDAFLRAGWLARLVSP